MSQATHGHSTATAVLPAPSRRSLFGAGAALLLLAPAAAGPAKATEIDGELLARCADYQAAEREADRLSDELGALPLDAPAPVHDPISARMDAAMTRSSRALYRIIDLPARTPEGIAAKAAALRVATRDGMYTDPDPHELLALSVADDITGRA